MAKEEMSDKELQVIIDIHKSLVNITSSLKTFEDTLGALAEMEQKHGGDLQILNERMKFLNNLYTEMRDTIKPLEEKLNTLVNQLDYKERIEILKKKNRKPFDWNKVWLVVTNSKWLAIILVSIVLIIVLIIGGPALVEKFMDSGEKLLKR